ncbi:MAG: phage major capsid protein [Clostridia bacterium]|nr:phage major capsid protein [Clostridia bacterium]
MVTLQTADNALKSFYLEAVSDTLNRKVNPFFAKVQQSTSDVLGKDVRKLVRYGVHGGVGAGSETGDLPKAGGNNYVQFVAPLKNLYGTIEISDKAIRASAGSEGAFVNLLNDEMEGLVKDATFQFGRMLFGPEKKTQYYFEEIENNVLTLSSVKNLFAGMTVYVLNESFQTFEAVGARRIKAVNRADSTITLEGTDVLSLMGEEVSGYIVIAKDYDNELTGLESIFGSGDLYGIKREDYDFMQPIVKTNVGAIDENVIQKVIDELDEISGSNVNFIICSWGVRRALVNYYKEKGMIMQTMEMEGGFKTLSFNGIPVVTDRFCPKGTMYLLNTDDFKLCQLCDWQWLESDDGKILKQVPGKPVYTATLVKYAELICERPAGQAKLTGITEA